MFDVEPIKSGLQLGRWEVCPMCGGAGYRVVPEAEAQAPADAAEGQAPTVGKAVGCPTCLGSGAVAA